MSPNPASTFLMEDPSLVLSLEEEEAPPPCTAPHPNESLHESSTNGDATSGRAVENDTAALPISPPPPIHLKMRLTQSDPSLDSLRPPPTAAADPPMSRSSSGLCLSSMATTTNTNIYTSSNTAGEQRVSKVRRRRSYSEGAGPAEGHFEPVWNDSTARNVPSPHSPTRSSSQPLLTTPPKPRDPSRSKSLTNVRDGDETPLSPMGRQLQKMKTSFRKTTQRTSLALQQYKRERAIRRQKRLLQRQFIIQQRQKKLEQEQLKSKWLIPTDHPLKVFWDVITVFISFLGAYLTHTSIRDRTIEQTFWITFTEAWFLVDILLNFVTQHKTASGKIIADGKAVWARYLTTWFVVDVLSLVPWESIYVKPIWEMQKRRGFFKKTFFRSKAVIRVTRILRGRHFKWFGKVASQTKHAGVGSKRLLQIMIKYIPKYLLFYRNMKGVLAVRTLRQVHWIRKVIKNLFVTTKKEEDEPLVWIVPALKKNHRHHVYKNEDDDTFTETDIDEHEDLGEDHPDDDDYNDDDDKDEISFEFLEEEDYKWKRMI
mmetsp:Transcript_7095/g.10782  ORF Transcript_7095/g.10782 Transcript_7095/m.10782 type:complete len:541 (-) Transcript_7095:139-1761(-)